MGIQSKKTDDVHDAPSAEPDDGKAEPECRAAYVLARNVHLIEGWLFAVRRLEHYDDPGWGWRFPNSLLRSHYDVPPVNVFAEIDDALRDLAVAGRANAAVLVELHRSLDAAAESCARLAEFAKWNEREEIREEHSSFGYDIQTALWLVQRILHGEHNSVDTWFRLGERVGALITEKGLRSDEWYRSTISEILDDAASISAADVARLRRILNVQEEKGEDSYRKFKIIAQAIDEEFMRCLGGALPVEAWIVLNDQRRILTFLGVDIPFDDFPDEGGLKILRAFIQQPDTLLSTSQIVERAGLGADPNQDKSYVSRFRAVVKKSKEQWPAHFRNAPHEELAEMAFVVCDQRAKKLAKSKDSFYKLSLPAHRVMHVPADTLSCRHAVVARHERRILGCPSWCAPARLADFY
jgi:hypothetical protein